MTLDTQDWRGEHLIRCTPRESDDDSEIPGNELDLRRKKVAKLINMNLTATQIAQRIGCSANVVYKDAAKLGMKLTGAKAPGPRQQTA